MKRGWRWTGESYCNDRFSLLDERDLLTVNDEILLHERIDVVATFSPGYTPCRPVKFRRPSGREVMITKIGLGYPHARGTRTVHIFDVTDGQADYRLEFDSVTLAWWLVREADHVS